MCDLFSYYLQGTITNNVEMFFVDQTKKKRVEKEVRKKKSNKVKFNENLIQGPTLWFEDKGFISLR